jgi:hypothetical protein
MIKKMAWVALVLWLVVIALVATGHGAISKKPSNDNAFGAVIDFSNPNTYKEGNVVAMAYLEGDQGIVARIQPVGTYTLFTEDILFCGAPVEQFIGKSNPIVLTYETKAHRTVQGVGCHVLKHVDEIKASKDLHDIQP